MKRIILLIIAAVAVSGCRERLSSDDRYDDLALLIAPTIAGATSTQPQTSPAHTANYTVTTKSDKTRAAGDVVVFTKSAWAASDKIGVYLTLKTNDEHQWLNFEGSTYNDLTYYNIPYTYAGGSFSTVGKYYYPYRRSQVDLWGIYPYDDNLGKTDEKRNSSAYPWSVFADQSVQGNKNGAGSTTIAPAFNILQSDLLFAKTENVEPNNTGATVGMVFKHMMNKLFVRMLVPSEFDGRELAENDPIEALTIMNTRVDALVNFNVDTVVANGDKPTMIKAIAAGDAAPEVGEGVTGHYYYFDAITVPQLIAGETNFIKIDINFKDGSKDAFVLKLTDDLLLRKGMKQTLDLQFDLKLGLRLNGTRIEEWGAGDGGGGLITEVEAAPSANSYVVAPGDEVIINTLIAGNDAAAMSPLTAALRNPTTGVKSVALLWQTRSGHGFGSEAMVIESVTATNLKAVKVKTRGGTSGGNAVLAAYDGLNGTGNILWSWHIWVSPETIPLTSYGTKFVEANGQGKAIMDRNLGALSAKQASGLAKTGGMLYQWGRKDPFTGARDATTTAIPVFNLAGTAVAASAGTAIAGDASFKFLASDAPNVAGAIKNPMTIYFANATSIDWTNPADNLLWTSSLLCTSPLGVGNKGEKSIYDPCPDGYRVATGGTDGNGTLGDLGVNGGNYGAWSGTGTTTGRTFDELGGEPWYSAAGYRLQTSGVFSSIATQSTIWSATSIDDNNAIHNSVHSSIFANVVNPAIEASRGAALPVRCVQEANLAAHVTVVPVKEPIAAAGGTVNATVLTSMGLGWTATLSGAAAGTDGFNFGGGATTLNGTDNTTMQITVAANAGEARTAKLRVVSSYGTIYSEITLTQTSVGPATVTIGGAEWCSSNLTGTPEQGEIITTCANPEDYGMYFKWGSSRVYQLATSTSDGSWGSYTAGAATSPANTNTGGLDYDYLQGLSGGTFPGDPCKKLGASYRTPTRQQFINLYASRGNTPSNPFQQLNGIKGIFFGPNAQNISDNQSSVPTGMIFIPAAGSRINNGTQASEGSEGFYWSSSVNNSDNGYNLNFASGSVSPNNSWGRSFGMSVRCVKETPPPATVTIAGTKWTATNLTGTAGQGNTVSLCANPEDYGMYFKWGCSQVYAHGTSTNDGTWNGTQLGGAATNPTATNTGNLGYDYGQTLGGGTALSPGDPCKKLGASYRTPTRQQFIDLYASRGSSPTNVLQQLNGIKGAFFGPNAQNISGNQFSVPANMIFIPAAGCRVETGTQTDEEGYGLYWSSSISSPQHAYRLLFSASSINPNLNNTRATGLSVRCVKE